MVAHGFMLANLIRAQLATALIERMVAGGRPTGCSVRSWRTSV